MSATKEMIREHVRDALSQRGYDVEFAPHCESPHDIKHRELGHVCLCSFQAGHTSVHRGKQYPTFPYCDPAFPENLIAEIERIAGEIPVKKQIVERAKRASEALGLDGRYAGSALDRFEDYDVADEDLFLKMLLVKHEIISQFYCIFDKLGCWSDLLCVMGSYGDTMSDGWVLDELKKWNAHYNEDTNIYRTTREEKLLAEIERLKCPAA